jgi:predicted nucleic acid-binding protein
MSSDLSGDMVFDTSAFIELIDLTPKGTLLRESLVSNKLSAHLSEISLSETIYVLCRRLGYERSVSAVKGLIDTGYFGIEQSSNIYGLAGRYICERSLPIADCYSLALGNYLRLPVLFSRRETELAKEIKRKEFDVKIVFLED